MQYRKSDLCAMAIQDFGHKFRIFSFQNLINLYAEEEEFMQSSCDVMNSEFGKLI